MQNRPIKVQNQKSELDLISVPIRLDPEYPFSGIGDRNLYTLNSNPLNHLQYHDVLEIGYCYEGSGIFIVDNKIMPFSKGDASIVFRNEMHIAKSSPGDPSSWCFIYIDPVLLLNDIGSSDLPRIFSCLDGNSNFMNIIKPEENNELVTVILELIEEIRGKKDLFKDAVKGLTLCMLARLSRSMRKDFPKDAAVTGHSDMVRISPALNYIFRNHHGQIAIGELSGLCGMSPTNFRRVFTKTMKLSPLEFVNHFRIRMASVLLTGTDAPVLDISLRVGYDSLSSFNRHFKQITGIAPRDWRKR